MMTKTLQIFFAWQVGICKWIDQKVFGSYSIDGNKQFSVLVDKLILDEASVADVGGGKTPFFLPEEVRRRGLVVTGVDIDAAELDAAPSFAYSRTIVSALEECRGFEDHDFVIAQSVLEHVQDGRKAMVGISSLLRPGGTAVTFCPNRRAWFARLNLLLPERMKRTILFSVFPSKRERQGFPANYDGCTPGEMEENMRRAGIRPVEIKYYFVSSYFMFFVPLYLFWRLATYPMMRFWPHRYCETFIVVGVREAANGVRSVSA
jgi:2-polyprenyl-6-hydroxyphenyl methylase/3-demethylubiquinone-9 3-methyltransferase